MFGKKLLLIFFLALFLRLIFLGSVPAGFHNDEVDVGYVGKFIVLNGKDPAGNILPLAFNKFGDFRPTGLFYLAGISQLIFGSNEFAVRLPTALFGALTVFPLFFLARELFSSARAPVGSSSHSTSSADSVSDRVQNRPVSLRALGGTPSAAATPRTSLRTTPREVYPERSRGVMFLRWLPPLLKPRQDKSDVRGQLSNVSAQTVPLFAAFFLAILPWHIVLSRAGHEAIVGYFLIAWGLYFLFKFKDGRERRFLVYGFLFFVSSYLLYHGTRIAVPLLLLSLLPFFQERAFFRFVLVFVVLTAVIVLAPIGRGRLSQVIFYKDPGMVTKLRELPYPDRGNILVARVFHNKAVVYTRSLAGQYLQYFSPDFLFLRGGYPERYMVPEAGLLLIFMVLPFAIGLIALAARGEIGPLPIVWLLVAPISAVLTYDDIPNITRTSFMIIPIVLICAYGFWYLANILKNNFTQKLICGILLLAIFLEFVYFEHQYSFHQKLYKGILRDDGAREIVKYMASQKSKYELVVAPYGPNLPFYFLFYSDIFDRAIRLDIADRDANFRHGNVLFLRDSCPSHRADHWPSQNVLYIDEANCEVKPGKMEVTRVARDDATIAFRAYVVIE
ncbi:hypothetical protein A3B54_04725 [Candidatus Curtissbacteria bacterium RIFCSPLOWO2_01_FULL_42_50]|uniref:Glycosyltransferase RgtA/B/C/D-like domain-containing protein n=1 Tax=Candidatus Curtissbacteria bacterium RIFCSPLOWO2_01_FULL_42_50 TaxID=1797730 RepID=A0A1F5H4Q9_9BACT|nr:MAG: hypothetical protein A3E71_04805 [Candidatus Curtissbacteria bacterium RIFCSPHIGHO2_12_FULL_42_33]OGD99059.1 MAG: hypothetical protein A3B54_04725 [Candidatus Curtissbacteria bacterium RIFCSPLOWO2_01_FULL_42_50]